MPPLRTLFLDTLAVMAVVAALAVTAAGYVRNFPETVTGYAAGIDPLTTGSIEARAGNSTDVAATEPSDARPARPAASAARRVWTDPPQRSGSAGGVTGAMPAGTTPHR